eukprot:scaffold12285_cov136-Isochrysis_galbana.AAC.3
MASRLYLCDLSAVDAVRDHKTHSLTPLSPAARGASPTHDHGWAAATLSTPLASVSGTGDDAHGGVPVGQHCSRRNGRVPP